MNRGGGGGSPQFDLSSKMNTLMRLSLTKSIILREGDGRKQLHEQRWGRGTSRV